MNTQLKHLLLLFLVYCLGATTLHAQVGNEVMIQGFNWESARRASTLPKWYDVLKSKATDFKSSGIDAVWMPPPSNSLAIEGYLPRELNNLSSSYGTDVQLKDAIATLHANNIKAIADIVVNHRVGCTSATAFCNPVWDLGTICRDDENPGTGNNDSGIGYGAARDLDHSNAGLRSEIIKWLNMLKTAGFDGWRYDYVKGFNGMYIKEYNNSTNPFFSVGEYWPSGDAVNNQDPYRQSIVDWINSTGGTSTAFDFALKGMLHGAVYGDFWRLSINGKAPGVMGWWPAKAVTFIDNHDTDGLQKKYDPLGPEWPFPSDKVMIGYAYILTHPGIPMVHWNHFYDWGTDVQNQLKALIKARKDAGVVSTSALTIDRAQQNLYAAYVGSNLAMKLGSGSWTPSGTGWTIKASGADYAVWVKGTTPPPTPTVSITPAAGTYPCLVDVTIASEAGNTIYYTTNGTTPTAASTKYTAPIKLTVSATVKAIAINSSNVSSTVASNAYTIVSTLPTTPTVSPAGGSYAGSVTVTLTAPSGTTIYYTTNGTTPTAASTKYTAPFILIATATVKWIGVNCAGSSPAGSASYTITPSILGFKVYFKPTGYTNPNIYYWNVVGGSMPTVTWPGPKMTAEANGWFSFQFNATSANLIFSNNGASKTEDLSRNKTGWYKNGVWTDTNPEVCASSFKVYFKPTGYTNPNIYYWNVQGCNVMPAVTWPGVKMTPEVNGWFSYTISGTCTNLIFSNNGASKTVDLSRCGVGYYTNNTWSTTQPASVNAPLMQEQQGRNTIKQLQAIPNPAQYQTNFSFELDDNATVQLEVFNALGVRVSTILNRAPLTKGNHTILWNMENLQNGLYFYRLSVGNKSITNKLILSK